jgi:hypothetical protein
MSQSNLNSGQKFNATLPTLNDGEVFLLQSDVRGRLITSTGASNYINNVLNNTNLAAGASFVSPITDVLSAPAWVVSSRADQPLLITIQQYSDLAGTLLVETTTYTRAANNALNTSIKLSGSYARLTVQNVGASTTTSFLAEAWAGVLETLPTSLTNAGNLRVAIVENAISVPTFSASNNIAVTVTAASDVITINGSANRTVKILDISFSMTQGTAAVASVSLIKRSTANTGGTSTLPTAVAFDSANQGTATAVVRQYTVNPTLGTAVGAIASIKKQIATATQAADYNSYQFNFETPLTLRGVNESICINLGGGTFTGNNVAYTITWTEEQ